MLNFAITGGNNLCNLLFVMSYLRGERRQHAISLHSSHDEVDSLGIWPRLDPHHLDFPKRAELPQIRL